MVSILSVQVETCSIEDGSIEAEHAALSWENALKGAFVILEMH